MFLCEGGCTKSSNKAAEKWRDTNKTELQEVVVEGSRISDSLFLLLAAPRVKRCGALVRRRRTRIQHHGQLPGRHLSFTILSCGSIFTPRRNAQKYFRHVFFACCPPVAPLAAGRSSVLPLAPACTAPKCAAATSRWFPETPGPLWSQLAATGPQIWAHPHFTLAPPLHWPIRCCANVAPEARSTSLCVRLRLMQNTTNTQTEIRF